MRYKVIIKNNNIDNKKILKNINDFLFKFNWQYSENNLDYLFIIAGDGTFLKNINYYFKENSKTKYILIKNSSIGYYYDFKQSDIKNILLKLVENKLKISKMPLLEIKFINSQKSYFAANEIKILNFVKPIKINCHINDVFLKKMFGSGVVVSTCNGSSGFTNSLYGAIILENDLLQLKEIAPVINFKNNYFTSSYVLNGNNDINLSLNNDKFALIVDNVEINNENNDLNFRIKIHNKFLLKIGEEFNLEYKIKKMQKILKN